MTGERASARQLDARKMSITNSILESCDGRYPIVNGATAGYGISGAQLL